MTPEQDAIIESMSDDQIAERIEGLSHYERYNTLASIEYNHRRQPLTPKQMRAWAAFAEAMSDEAVMTDGTIYVQKPWTELAEKVADAEFDARRLAAERESELAGAIDFRSNNTHP